MGNKGIYKQKGITLIALVVTIVVLLILSGVAIASLTGDDNLLSKAQTSSETYEEKSAREKLQLELTSMAIEKEINKEYNSKNLLYDCATGAVNGLLAPITNGIGNTVTKTIGKKIANDSELKSIS